MRSKKTDDDDDGEVGSCQNPPTELDHKERGERNTKR